MSVINCKVKFIRPKYQNLKQWTEDINNVYIGRRGIVFIDNERFPKKDSPFCNPFKMGKNSSRDEVIKKYKEYILIKIEKEPELKNELILMKGKNLGCWCHPESCHGDILLELINSL
jgi:hypothetical protein